MATTSTPKPIGLTELIYQVKRELLSQESRRADPVPLFAVEKIELEIAVSLSRKGEGGINIQVLSLGGGVSRADAQTVRVTLKPLHSREELVAELRRRDPKLLANMAEESLNLLKGSQQTDRPSWP